MIIIISGATVALFFGSGINAMNLQGALTINIFRSPELAEKELILSQEELVDLVGPTVLRVVTKFKGTITIPAIKINFSNLTVSIDPSKSPTILATNNNIKMLIGSGFIVNPDGYIITSAHVVSDQVIKMEPVLAMYMKAWMQQAFSITKEEEDRIIKNNGENGMIDFAKKVFIYMMENSTSIIEKDIIVLNPHSQGQNMDDFIKSGFPVKIYGVNDNFLKDGKDVALLKISPNNLPSLKLSSFGELAVGGKTYVFGFPANADLSTNQNFLRSTFTQGVISAIKNYDGPIKNSNTKNFKVIQTDSKVSEGSSGGPLFNASGEALGVITSQSTPNSFSGIKGDNFAFAIPIELGDELLRSKNVLASTSGYHDSFKSGLFLLHNRRCKSAIEQFNVIKGTNDNFIDKERIDSYIKKCEGLIANGVSIDSKLDEIKENLKNVGTGGFVIIAVFLFLVLGGVVAIVFIRKRVKKEEEEIENLEKLINLDGSFKNKISNNNPASINRELQQYVTRAKQVGMTDDTIIVELKKAGWSDNDIAKALRG